MSQFSLALIVVLTILLSSVTFYLDLVTFGYLPTMRTKANQSHSAIKAEKVDNDRMIE